MTRAATSINHSITLQSVTCQDGIDAWSSSYSATAFRHFVLVIGTAIIHCVGSTSLSQSSFGTVMRDFGGPAAMVVQNCGESRCACSAPFMNRIVYRHAKVEADPQHWIRHKISLPLHAASEYHHHRGSGIRVPISLAKNVRCGLGNGRQRTRVYRVHHCLCFLFSVNPFTVSSAWFMRE